MATENIFEAAIFLRNCISPQFHSNNQDSPSSFLLEIDNYYLLARERKKQREKYQLDLHRRHHVGGSGGMDGDDKKKKLSLPADAPDPFTESSDDADDESAPIEKP